jgi:hypothetical protein
MAMRAIVLLDSAAGGTMAGSTGSFTTYTHQGEAVVLLVGVDVATDFPNIA